RREPVVGANRCPGTPNSPVSRERESQDLALAGVTSVISVLERRTIGAVAQWERITLAEGTSASRPYPRFRLRLGSLTLFLGLHCDGLILERVTAGWPRVGVP